MPLTRRFRIAVAGLAMGILAASSGAATTIDFEAPDLGGESWLVISPFVAGGVVFSAATPIGLVRECALHITRSEACGSCENQYLGSAAGPDCPVGVHDAPLKAEFLPEAGPVLSVSVVVQTLSYSILDLKLHDASGLVVGSGQASVAHAYGSCGDPGDGDMTSRGVVHAEASEPVAYAIVSVNGGWTCPGVPGCYVACNPFAIDDFAYGSASVPTRHSSWGGLKILYR